VTSYVSAKAIRSVYLALKRTWGWQWSQEVCVMHILLMGALFYLFNHRPSVVKFRNLFELIWGDE
jgi:hypothetical protein